MTTYKIRSSSVIEAIIAALVILISFAAGIAIYTKVIFTTSSSLKMRAELELDFLADSLAHEPQRDQEIKRLEMRFTIEYTDDERFSSLSKLHLVCYDNAGKLLKEKYKIIRNDKIGQN